MIVITTSNSTSVKPTLDGPRMEGSPVTFR